MVFGLKPIAKPLVPLVLETKNHRKIIDINGDLPSIHSMAMVSIKGFKCCNGDNHKANNSVLGESTIKTINIIIFVDFSVTLKKKLKKCRYIFHVKIQYIVCVYTAQQWLTAV